MDKLTSAEAIEAIKNNMPTKGTYTILTEALGMAIEALERQEPIKPTYDRRYVEMGCSCCGNIVGGWEERPYYCPNCGQKIDWSEEECQG